jgi:YesN/AraC family two-component response regulator
VSAQSTVATVRVLIVDDDPLVRAGLRMILSSADDIDVVGEAGDGSEASAAVDAHRPHVVLMDIRMPRRDGIAATAALRGRPDAPEAGLDRPTIMSAWGRRTPRVS